MQYPERKDYQKSLPKPTQEQQKVYNFERATVPDNNVWQHIKDKVREQPLIPLTFGATLFCFGMMVRYKNDPARLNLWGRYRLLTQAACFVSVFGAMYQEQRKKTGGWMPFQWFSGESAESKEMRKKYFEKH